VLSLARPTFHALNRPARRLLAGLLALAAAAAVAPAAASARPLYGVQGIPLYPGVAQGDVDRALDQARSLHAKVVRIEVQWSQLEPQAAGQRDPAVLDAADRVVASAAKRGIKVLLMMQGTPCWASSAPADVRGTCTGPDANRNDVTRYPPSQPGGYVSAAAFLVKRYGAKLAAFEIWNEPDQANEKYWAGPDKVARYVALVKAAYKPLKAADRHVKVLAGSFVGVNGKWLEAMYQAGIKGHYDALSVHFYDLPLYGLRNTRAIQRRHHDAKPLWLAEFGFTSCYAEGGPVVKVDHVCLTRKGESQNLVDSLRTIARYSYIKAAVVYTLADESDAYQFGLVDANGRPKPAFAAVRNIFAGRGGRVTRPRLTLRARGGQLQASGTATQVDVLQIRVRKGGVLRYIANLRTDRFGAYGVALPASLGTHGLTVTLSAGWTGAVTRRR
jgi:hypothetical protein